MLHINDSREFILTITIMRKGFLLGMLFFVLPIHLENFQINFNKFTYLGPTTFF